MQAIIDALYALSARIGWPEAYKTDLDHDAVWLRKNLPARFLWMVRATGTEIRDDRAGTAALSYQKQPHRYFAFEAGPGLVELTREEALDWMCGPASRQRLLAGIAGRPQLLS
jgi:hypothetical protein